MALDSSWAQFAHCVESCHIERLDCKLLPFPSSLTATSATSRRTPSSASSAPADRR